MPFVTCGPDEVLVVSGVCLPVPLKISRGGRKFILKGLQKYQKLSLNIKTILVVSPKIYTKLGVPITVTGVAQVKIESKHKEMLNAACENFLSYSNAEVVDTIKETLEAHQRAIMGVMTVEEIYMDRQKFSEEVFRVASADLMHLGVSVVSYTIKDVSDDEGYLASLGKARTAQVICDARISEAEAYKDAEIRKARAELALKRCQFENKSLIAKAERDFLLQQAGFTKETKTKQAIAEIAYNLQEVITKQAIMIEKKEVEVIERNCQIQLEELKVNQSERRLTATVRKSAEAEKFRLEILAAAEKVRLTKNAEAEAEKMQILGDAKAYAISTVGAADAEQMSLKANAMDQYKKAAKVDMLLNVMPSIVAEIAQPIANSCQKITMVSNGDNAQIGVAKLSEEIISVVKKLHCTVTEMSSSSRAGNADEIKGLL